MKRARNWCSSTSIADSAIMSLLQNVDDNQLIKFLAIKAKKVVAGELMNREKQFFLQLCPNTKDHQFSRMKEDKGPNNQLKEHCRPLSANLNKIRVERETVVSVDSRRSRARKYGSARTKHSQNSSCVSRTRQNTRIYSGLKFSKDESRFFPVQSEHEFEQQPEIDRLRQEKQKQQVEQRKREMFLQTVKTDAKTFQRTQLKFMNWIGQKEITYNYKGEIVQLRKQRINNIKKVQTSRIVFQDISDRKDRPFTAKIIAVAYNHPEGQKREHTRNTEVLDCEDGTEKLFKNTQNTNFQVIR